LNRQYFGGRGRPKEVLISKMIGKDKANRKKGSSGKFQKGKGPAGTPGGDLGLERSVEEFTFGVRALRGRNVSCKRAGLTEDQIGRSQLSKGEKIENPKNSSGRNLRGNFTFGRILAASGTRKRRRRDGGKGEGRDGKSFPKDGFHWSK